MIKVQSGSAGMGEKAIQDAAILREHQRKDGYLPKIFTSQDGKGQLFILPAFITPILDVLPIGFAVLTALEEAAKQRPQCLEDAWDYLLPGVEEIRACCAKKAPAFETLGNPSAAAFGRAELARVLREGFSASGRPSPALWAVYRPTIQEWLKKEPPQTRPVDLHPADYLATSERPFGSGRHETLMVNLRKRLGKDPSHDRLLLSGYIDKAYEKQIQTGHVTKAFSFWKKYGMFILVAPLSILFIYTIVIELYWPHESRRNARHIISTLEDVVDGAKTPFAMFADGVQGLIEWSSSPGEPSTEKQTVNLPEWSEQTIASYEPTSLNSVDNGKRPQRTEQQQEAFDAWMEK